MSMHTVRRERRRREARRLFFAPRMENLEARLCLSCTASMDGGFLHISGDEGDNHIRIRGGDGELTLQCDDMAPEHFSGIERLSVDTAAGDDVVIVRLADGRGRGNPRNQSTEVAIDLGDGDDTAEVRTRTSSSISLDLISESGRNNIIAVLIGLLQPAAQKVRTSNVDITTGDNDDSIQIEASGFDDTGAQISAGGGDDLVLIKVGGRAFDKSTRESALALSIDVGVGHDRSETRVKNIDSADVDVHSLEGHQCLVFILGGVQGGSAAQKVRTANVAVSSGDGVDSIDVKSLNYDVVETSIDAGGGEDDVSIVTRSPRAQKVRESEVHNNVQLGGGGDSLTIVSRGALHVDNSVDAGDGESADSIWLDLGYPVRQATTESSASNEVNLHGGDNSVEIRSSGYIEQDNLIRGGDGNNHVDVSVILRRLANPHLPPQADVGVHNEVILGAGDNRVSVENRGVQHTINDIASGDGDNSVLIGLLLPAVQKVRDAAATSSHNTLRLGNGDNEASIDQQGVQHTINDITSGDGDNSVLIGLLLPAVQKVRDAAARSQSQNTLTLGGGDNRVAIDQQGVQHTINDITSGDGDNSVLIGLLLPAVQKVRDAAARSQSQNTLTLGGGANSVEINSDGYDRSINDIITGGGNNIIAILIGLLQPAAQKVNDPDGATSSANTLQLGGGDNNLSIESTGYDRSINDIITGGGNNIIAILIGLLQPAAQKVNDPEGATSSVNTLQLGGGDDHVSITTLGAGRPSKARTEQARQITIIQDMVIDTGDGDDVVEITTDLRPNANTVGKDEKITISGGRTENVTATQKVHLGEGDDSLRYAWRDSQRPGDLLDLNLSIEAGEAIGHKVQPLGDRIIVEFEHGDAHQPIVIGAVWNSDDAPSRDEPGQGGKRLDMAISDNDEGVDFDIAVQGGSADDRALVTVFARSGANAVHSTSNRNHPLFSLHRRVKLSVDAGEGDDDVRVEFNGGSYAEQKVRIAGNEGDDAIDLFWNNVSISGEMLADVDGGVGDNTLDMVARGVAVHSDAFWVVNGLEIQQSIASLNFALADGSVRIITQGTSAADRLSAEIAVERGRGSVQAELHGLGGDDHLALSLIGGRRLRELLGLIDGGEGTDTCAAVGPVEVVNCEDGGGTRSDDTRHNTER